MRRLALICMLCALSAAASPPAREGWVVRETGYSYADLIERLKLAVKASEMHVVTQAGPTDAAKRRGIDIPGNRVIGVFNNQFAVRMLAVSEAAMIEAPVRFYITEQPSGAATLSYKTPSHVFAPYFEDDPDVRDIAVALDAIFAAIAAAATK